MKDLTPSEETTLNIMRWEFQGIEDGCKKYAAIPTKHFWDLWRHKKDYLKMNGVSVSKVADTFVVYKFVNQSNVGQKFKGKPIKALMYPDLLYGKQKQHVIDICNALINYGTGLDASVTGAGKTFCARAVAKELGLDIFILSPFNSISKWQNVCKEIGVQASVINYEKIRTFKTEYLQKVDVPKNDKNKYDNSDSLKWMLPKETLIIFDEAHRLANYKTISSDILLAATKQGFDTLLLSATLADSPLKMQIVGFALRLFSTLKGFWTWAFKHGAKKTKDDYGNSVFYFDDRNPQHLKNINAQLFPSRGGRLTKADLPELFTDTFITAEAYNMKSAKKIQDIYDNFGEGSEDYMKSRMHIEMHKIDTIVQLAHDSLEEGNSVCIFVNFKQTLFSLAEILGTNCVVHGEQRNKKQLQERENNLKRFQENKEKLIILTTPAGSESIELHDTDGNHPRESFISPTDDSVALKQVFGRVDRAGGKSNSVQRLIYAADTVEEKIARRVHKKLRNLSLLNDGDLIESFEMKEVN